MNNFKYVHLLVISFLLVTATQAAPTENASPFLNAIDLSPTYPKWQTFTITHQEWYVILGTYLQNKKGYRTANALSNKLIKRGYEVIVGESDFYEGLKDGLVVVMMGPFYSQRRASTKRNALKHIVRDAYIRQITYQGD